nr:hypothetical protein [Tanacetum cinerariifolium]
MCKNHNATIASLDTVHTNIVGNAQTIYNESPNSAYLSNEDSSQSSTLILNHSKRTWQNPHPRLAPGNETAFSVAAHVNNVNSTSSTSKDSSRVSILASNPRKRTHQNALARSVQSEESPSKRVLRSTLRVENRRVTTVTSGSGEGCSSDQTGGSELSLASYRLIEDYFPATCEQELCPFNFLLASCKVSSNELSLASYRLIEDYFPTTCEQELCPLNFLLASCKVSSNELSLASYRPPMLDRIDFASWQQRIRLYCRGKENEMGTLRETLTEGTEGASHLGLERPRVYSDLTSEEKDRYNADIQATNILLQGLPKDIYSLINHYTDAKDIWDNVKMLIEGSELTKEDRESQMMQLNSKFVNNMLPEWGRFVTAVKLNRGLRDSNYDQLYAYLKQQEVHANENKMMLNRFTQHTVDPLALMSNVSNQQHYPQSSTTSPSTYVQPHSGDITQLDSGLSPTDNLIENLTNTLALLTQSYKTYIPQTNNQLRTSSNPRYQTTIQDGRVVVQNVQGRQNRGQGNNARGAGAAGYGGSQNRVGYVNPGGQDNVVDEDVDEQPVQDLALNVDNVFQTNDCDAFDFDVDEAPTAQTLFMANISSADPVYDKAVCLMIQMFYLRKCDEIERKNILIANDTLIANWLSKDVFYIAKNSKLNVSRFSEMHDAHTVVQERCLELETELSELKDNIQKDDHDVMVILDFPS